MLHSPCCVDGHYGSRMFSVVLCFPYELAMGSGGIMTVSPSQRRDGGSQRSRCTHPHPYRTYVRFASFRLRCLSFPSSHARVFLHFSRRLYLGILASDFFPIFFLGWGVIRFGGGSEALALALDCLLEVWSCERAAFRLSCPWAWNWPGRDGRRTGCLHRGRGGIHFRPSVLPICLSDSGHADGDVPRESVPEAWIYRQKRETEVQMGVDRRRRGCRCGCVWWIARVGVRCVVQGARRMCKRDWRAGVVQIQMR
ncbi:hypothetical protein B0H13DRAFT_527999 [Mycena leptocephala]|nr:hypothetical protein B0H13DRAFT_527999 [Mycena leptocephala]